MCANKERGCEWQGELNDISSHLGNSDGCQFEDVKCSNECGKMLQRRYLTSHVETECPGRIIKCELCQISGRHQFIEGEHKKQCPKLPISCPNKCRFRNIAREDMEAHRKECPLEMVQCEYHNVGCEERMMRKRKKKHEQEKIEDHLLMTKFGLSKEAETAKTKLASTEAKLASTETKLAITTNKLHHVEVMLHRLIESSGHSKILIDSPQWPIHLSMISTKIARNTCPVVIKVSNFAAMKEGEVNCKMESFFSHTGGYKMSCKVYPDGNDDTHLSVFLCLMKGPHDDELTWPLRTKFNVRLLNQINDYKHYSGMVKFGEDASGEVAGRVTGDENTAGWGKKLRLISIKELFKVTPVCQYIRDDCIFVQINQLQ